MESRLTWVFLVVCLVSALSCWRLGWTAFSIKYDTQDVDWTTKQDWKQYSDFGNASSQLRFARYRLVRIEDRAANAATDSTVDSEFETYHGLEAQLAQGATTRGDERLVVLLVDPLAWLLNANPELYSETLQAFVDDTVASRAYSTFKGSDHLFVCLSRNCGAVGKQLAEALSQNMGSRAIFAGVDLTEGDLKWPCPVRIVNLSRLQPAEEGLADEILRHGTHMIERRNRWICADASNPPNYFSKHGDSKPHGAIYMEEYGLVMCQLPKCGSTMLMFLLRRMMHMKNWKPKPGMNPHNNGNGSFRKIKNEKDSQLVKKLYEDPSVVKAVVVRHPATRLLSAYLDKIVSKGQLRLIGGLEAYVKQHGFPKFPEFVQFLVEHYPDANKLSDHHFKPQSDRCGLRRHRFDFVGRLGELGTEFREFSESVGIWEDYVATGWGPDGQYAFGDTSYKHTNHEHNATNHIWQHYDEETLHKVYVFYKEDFERFGFTLDEILATKPVS